MVATLLSVNGVWRDAITDLAVPGQSVFTLAPADTAQGQTTEALTFAATPTLVVADTAQGQAADAPTLSIPSTSKYLNLPGTSGQGARIADDPTLDLTGDQTLYVLMRPIDWTPPTDVRIILSKWSTATSQLSFVWGLATTGGAYYQASANSSTWSETPTPAPVPAQVDDTWVWVRFVYTHATRRVVMSTAPVPASPDPTVNPATLTWTSVADSGAATGLAATFSSSAPLVVGATNSLSSRLFIGRIAQLVLAGPSGVVFRLDPSNWVSGTTWVTSTGHTVTLNGAASVVNL